MTFVPSLGSSTAVRLSAHRVYFTASPERDERKSEVWTNLPSGEWHAVEFGHGKDGLLFACVDVPPDQNGGHYEFTYRYRNDDGSYEWLGQEGSNGSIQLLEASASPQCGINVQTFEVSVKSGVSGEYTDIALRDIVGDKLGPDFDWTKSAGIVLEQSEPTWFKPRRLEPSSDPFKLLSHQHPAQFLFLRIPASSQIIFLLPTSTAEATSALINGGETAVLRCTRETTSEVPVKGTLLLGVAEEGDLKALVAACVEKAATVVLKPRASDTIADASSSKPLRGITWCTWNALGQDYVLSEVLSSLEKLEKATEVSPLYREAVDSVLLDDGWQDVKVSHEKGRMVRRLSTFGVRSTWFDVEREALDDGKEELQQAVRLIKGSGKRRVGVWLTHAGYWNGVDPESGLAAKYNVRRLNLDSSTHTSQKDTWYFPVTRDDIKAFYTDYFTHLRSAGVDFIKVDDQAHSNYLASCDDSDVDVGMVRIAMLEEMRAAAHSIFGKGNVTHCMSHVPRIWGSSSTLIPTTSSHKDILRNSDDYFPHADGSHIYHVYYNALTSILSSAFPGVTPDFDMCEEDHAWGDYHISFRSFQVAPILSTDREAKVARGGSWEKMLAKTKLGSTKVIQGNQTGAVLEGRSLDEVTGHGVGPALVVGVQDDIGSARLGLWNCREGGAESQTIINTRDVLEALGGGLEAESYLVYSPSTKTQIVVSRAELQASKGLSRVLARPLLNVTLGEKQSTIVTIAPVCQSDGISVACLGLLDKFAASAALSGVAFGVPTPPHAIVAKVLVPAGEPKPEGRLSLLPASVFPTYLRSQSSASVSKISRRTTARDLLSDFWRRPIHTFWQEITTLLGFTFGAIIWTLTLKAREKDQRREAVKAGSALDKKQGNGHVPQNGFEKKVLRVETPFTGRLGFYFGEDVKPETTKVTVDGQALPKEVGLLQEGSLYSLDLDKIKAQGLVRDDGNENWIVEISF